MTFELLSKVEEEMVRAVPLVISRAPPQIEGSVWRGLQSRDEHPLPAVLLAKVEAEIVMVEAREGLKEIAPPDFCAALSVKEEVWMTDEHPLVIMTAPPSPEAVLLVKLLLVMDTNIGGLGGVVEPTGLQSMSKAPPSPPPALLLILDLSIEILEYPESRGWSVIGLE